MGAATFGTAERPITTDNQGLGWVAYFTGEYCGCGTCRSLIGSGRSEEEAVTDLLDQDSERPELDD